MHVSLDGNQMQLVAKFGEYRFVTQLATLGILPQKSGIPDARVLGWV